MIHFWLKYPKFYDLIQIAATGGYLKKVASSLPKMKNPRIIDLGCGTGNLVEYINPKRYFGGDINPNFVELARRKYPDRDFQVFDLLKSKFPKDKFDYAVIMNVLHHLTDKQVLKVFDRIQSWGGAKELIIVESRPRGLIGNFLESLDAGENFRDFEKLKKIILIKWKFKKTRIVMAPFGTYEYLVAQCRPLRGIKRG